MIWVEFFFLSNCLIFFYLVQFLESLDVKIGVKFCGIIWKLKFLHLIIHFLFALVCLVGLGSLFKIVIRVIVRISVKISHIGLRDIFHDFFLIRLFFKVIIKPHLSITEFIYLKIFFIFFGLKMFFELVEFLLNFFLVFFFFIFFFELFFLVIYFS